MVQQHLQNDEVWREAQAETMRQHRTMLTDLLALHEQAEPLEYGGAIIRHTLTKQYLSGLPYPWSIFADRAFRFPTKDVAWNFIQKHQLNAIVHSQEDL